MIIIFIWIFFVVIIGNIKIIMKVGEDVIRYIFIYNCVFIKMILISYGYLFFVLIILIILDLL